MAKEGDLRSYLGALAHALKAPMAAILLWAEILEARSDDPATRARAIAAIRQGVKAEARLVDRLGELSRCLDGSVEIEAREVSIARLIEQALAETEEAARVRRVTIATRVDPSVGTVPGDGARLGQVLSALLSRAIATSQPGGRVELEAEPAGASVRLRVRDYGRGIPAHRLSHALDGTAEERGGLSLELALVAPLIKLHHGRVEVASDGPGRGATFTVWLPRTARKPASAGRSRARASRTARRALRR